MNNLKLELIKVLKKLTKYNSENIYELYFRFRANKSLVKQMSQKDMLILRVILFEESNKNNYVLLKYIIEKLRKLTVHS